MKSRFCFAVLLLVYTALAASAQQQQQGAGCPMHEKHMAAQAQASVKPEDNKAMRHDGMDAMKMDAMNARGDKAMGFSQGKTTHHFRLLADGGAIEVEANEAQDADSRASIRQHLSHIAQAFADGDFDTPMFIHAQVPPGVAVMKKLRAAIKYEFEETEHGARIRISTANAEALAAIRDFLTFQINEHQTGDQTDK
jgi:hypothetical protein